MMAAILIMEQIYTTDLIGTIKFVPTEGIERTNEGSPARWRLCALV
jgi:hypothetical protein